MNLKSLFLVSLATLVLGTASGCNFLRKSKKPKTNPNISAQVEADFRERWMDRRVAELTAGGTGAGAAREQAAAEFLEKFPHLKPVGGK